MYFLWLHAHPMSVPEEQEVSIEFVVNSVVRAFERNREARRAIDPSLPSFRVNIEV